MQRTPKNRANPATAAQVREEDENQGRGGESKGIFSCRASFPMGPDEFAELGKALAGAGARIIGGCCGTSPAHITALADALGA